jgi:arginine utilization protein RocB
LPTFWLLLIFLEFSPILFTFVCIHFHVGSTLSNLCAQVLIPKTIERLLTNNHHPGQLLLPPKCQKRALEITTPLDCWVCVTQLMFSGYKTTVTILRTLGQ